MNGRLGHIARTVAGEARGSASVELAMGAVVLLTVSALCFDLYARIRADTALARMAVAMADYVSRDTTPNGNDMTALGQFLYENEIAAPASVVFVVTAVHQPPGDPLPAAAVLWSDDGIRIGDQTATGALAGACARHVGEGGAASLPDGFSMSADEVVIIAEVCARLSREGSLTSRFIGGDIYRLHALPAREPGTTPAAPAYVQRWRVLAAAPPLRRYGACAQAALRAPCASSPASARA